MNSTESGKKENLEGTKAHNRNERIPQTSREIVREGTLGTAPYSHSPGVEEIAHFLGNQTKTQLKLARII